MKIAWFTPFGRGSAIGRYSAIVLDQLAASHDVVVYSTGAKSAAESWRPEMRVEPIDGRGDCPDLHRALDAFDVRVYHLGNHVANHVDIYRAQRARPGISVLHDLSMWHFFWEWYCGRPQADAAGWLERLEFCHGREARAWGETLLDGRTSWVDRPDVVTRYHMARGAAHGSWGVVVHGTWARDTLRPLVDMPVEAIDFPAPDLPAAPPRTVHAGRVRVLTFGVLGSNKLPDVVLEAFAGSPRLRAGAEYVVAGNFPSPEFRERVLALVAELGLRECVRFVPNPDDPTLHGLIADADVVVNLRYPHLGECSWSLLESLWQGKPTVVWDHGYYGEFPDHVVRKVGSCDALAATLTALCGSPETRLALGAAAAAYAAKRFSTAAYCESLLRFVGECRRDRPVCELVDRLSGRMAEVGGSASSAGLVDYLSAEVGRLAPAGAGELLPSR